MMYAIYLGMKTDLDLQNELEKLVDSSNLANVLEALAYIVREKSDHINTNWGDKGLALAWERTAKLIDVAQSKAMREKI